MARVYPGPTWVSIPRSDRRLHSFSELLLNRSGTNIRDIRVPWPGQIKLIDVVDAVGAVRDGDLIYMENKAKTKMVIYYITGYSPTGILDGAEHGHADIEHFYTWLGSSDDADWWSRTLTELYTRLHSFGKKENPMVERGVVASPTRMPGKYRLWVYRRDESDTYPGVWWPDDQRTPLYVAGRFKYDGSLVQIRDTAETFDEAWKIVMHMYNKDVDLAELIK